MMESASGQLTNMTRWAHVMLEPVLAFGALAVDLTAGNGHDTLHLWRGVGLTGKVVAFDIQTKALDNTAYRLREAGAQVYRHVAGQPVSQTAPGVYLIEGCHSQLPAVLDGEPVAVMANLGYLPGGDHALITRRDTTLQAIRCAAETLAPGGRLIVTAYPGHAGGDEESRAVQDYFSTLDARHWSVLRLCSSNRPRAPLLLVAEKRSSVT